MKAQLQSLHCRKEHLEELDTEICHIVEHSHEGQILLSIFAINNKYN
jgi:hypothetical protein